MLFHIFILTQIRNSDSESRCHKNVLDFSRFVTNSTLFHQNMIFLLQRHQIAIEKHNMFLVF